MRDSQAPNYFKETLETISRDDKANLVSANIHLTSIAPDKSKDDLRYMIARVSCTCTWHHLPSYCPLGPLPTFTRTKTPCGY